MNLRLCSSRIRGFTLVELFVTLGVFAALSLLVAPAFAKTKGRTSASTCLYNKRQLMLAWQLYAQDSGARVVNNFGVTETLDTCTNRKLETWANNVMTWTAGSLIESRSVTNLVWVRDGVLGKYTGERDTAYRCPADVFLSPPQVRAGFSHRVRSVAMNCLWGRFSLRNDGTEKGRNPFLPLFRQFLKTTDCPSPERTWVLLDEHPDSINDGYYLNNPTATTWQDIPGSQHDGGLGIAFADGHCELKRWASARSQYPVKFSYPVTRAFDAAGRDDFQWLRTRTGYVKLDGTRMYGY